MSVPFLIGDRIVLRPLGAEDVDRCMRWINDSEIQARIGRRHPMGRVQEEEWLAGQYKCDDHLNLAIVVKDGDRHIGNCGFNRIDFINRNAEFGILIGERDAWGCGYGPEAARLILQYGFEELGFHRIGLGVFAFNERAIRAYKRVGFVREGAERESYFRHGRFHDHIRMSVLESEWRERRDG